MPSGTTETFYDCMDAKGNTNSGKAECIDGETTRQDKRLNDFYRALLSGLREENTKQALIDAQRKWLETRKNDAEFERFIYGKERIEEIQSALNDLLRLTQRAALLLKWMGSIDIEDAAMAHKQIENAKAVNSPSQAVHNHALPTLADQDEPSFPIEVQGAWELGPRKCRAPLSVDSTSGFKIGSKTISGYEHTVRILQQKKLSSNPAAWSIHAMDYYSGEQTETKELFIISDDSLTITDGSYSKTYRRCPEEKTQ